MNIWGKLFSLLSLFPLAAFAEEGAHAATAGVGYMGAVAAALGIALAVIAAATAQGKIAASYMEGCSRNPGAEKAMKTQLILSLAFVETLVIFTLGIALFIIAKI